MNARLIVPSEEYLLSYSDACRNLRESGTRLYSIEDPDRFEEWRHTLLTRYEAQRRGEGLPDGFVPSSMFWLVEGDTMIGAGNIRHRLTPALERYGGHIGYLIRADLWGQGYGTLQLKLLLAEAAKLGIRRALITCDESNTASARVMEKNGGIWQDTIDNVVAGVPVRTKRYWVDTAQA